MFDTLTNYNTSRYAKLRLPSTFVRLVTSFFYDIINCDYNLFFDIQTINIELNNQIMEYTIIYG